MQDPLTNNGSKKGVTKKYSEIFLIFISKYTIKQYMMSSYMQPTCMELIPVLYSNFSPIAPPPRKTYYIVAFSPGGNSYYI